MSSTLSTRRVFDKEDERSLKFIAESADTLSRYSAQPRFHTLYLKEEDSRNANALQAADIEAGIARILIDTEGFRPLASKFRSVWVNGVALDAALR